MKLLLGGLVFIVLASGISCISDSNRCGKGQRYVEETPEGSRSYYCEDLTATEDTESDSELVDSGPSDGGQPNGESNEPLVGLGETCTDQDTCAPYPDASYCVDNPGDPGPGYCAPNNCVVTPNSCPLSYFCCDFTNADLPNFCVTKKDLEAMGSMCAAQ